MAGLVFISHSSDDADVAQRVCKTLEAAGIECWIAPRDIPAGHGWDEGVAAGIHASPVMIVIYTENTQRRPANILDEVNAAKNRDTSVFAFRLTEDQPSGVFDLRLGRYQWIDGFPPPLEEHAHKLVENIRFLLEGQLSNGDRQPVVQAGPPAGPPRPKLPRQNPHFVGREDVLGELETNLGGSGAIVAIIGAPGFGKTQLAVEYAYGHLGDYEIVCSISAEGRRAAIANFAALTETLGLPAEENQDKAVAAVRTRFADSNRWLLILDNVEQRDDVTEVMPEGNGNVIVTSQRKGWRALGAAEVRVGPMSTEEATRFLLRRTGRTDEAAVAVAQELKGYPLFLAQAGAYLDSTDVSFAEYLELLLEDPLRALEEEAPGDYPRTATATWQLAFAKVLEESPEAAELLRLSAFLAPDDVPIRQLGLALTAVNALVQYSLAQRTGEDAFSVHRVVQQMVRMQLADKERTSCAQDAVRLLLDAFPSDPSDILNRTRCTRLLPHALAALEHADGLGTDGTERATLLDRVASFHQSRARYADARSAFDKALHLLEADDKSSEPQFGTVLNHLGKLLRELGDQSGALTCIESALAIHESTCGPADPEVGFDRANLGEVLAERGDYAGAKVELEHALAIHEQAFGTDQSVAQDLMSLVSVLVQAQNIAEARRYLDRAIAVFEALDQEEHPSAKLARYIAELFAASSAGAEPTSGREKLEALVSTYEEAYGKDHPEIADVRQLLADELLTTGDLEGAANNYEAALTIDERAFTGVHQRVGRDLMRLSAVRAAQGEDVAADELLTNALSVFENLPSVETPTVPLDLASFDAALDTLGSIAGATAEFERILASTRRVTGHDGPLVASALDHLGAELCEAQELERARDELENALSMFERHLGPQHVRVARCLSRLGAVLRYRGELAAAEAAYERAFAIYDLSPTPNAVDLMNDLLALYPVRVALDERAAADDPSAERLAPRILDRLKDVAGHAVGLEPLRAFAQALREAGRLEDARRLHENVLETLEETYGGEHPEVAEALNHLGLVHVDLGELVAARRCFERALAIHEKAFGGEHQTVAEDLVVHLSPVLAGLGEHELAERKVERGLAIFERRHAASGSRVAQVRTDAWLSLGDFALAQARTGDAQILYERGLEFVREPTGAAMLRARLGTRTATGGDVDAAYAQFQMSSTLFKEAGSTDPFWSVVRACSPALRRDNERRPLDDALRQLREALVEDPIERFRPQLTAPLPPDWFAKESMTLLAPDGQANVIASSEPLDPTIDTSRYAEVQGELLRNEFPAYEEHAFEETGLLGGRRGYFRHFEWTPPDGVPVTQLQLYYAEDGRGYTATATTPSSSFPRFEVELRQLLAGLQISS